MTEAITLKPVGRVKNQIKEPLMFSHENGLELKEELLVFWEKVAEMKQLTSEIVINPARTDLLNGIEEYSHLIVFYWGHKTPAAGRALNQVHPMGVKDLPLTGVFTTYSPARPNPLLMTVVKLVNRRQNVLTVMGLDALDQSPVLDIKPYVKELFPQQEVTAPDWMNNIMEQAGRKTA
ncbi:tRNA (N6-threonylcarbamoyladenosine(37)-N6)-methyltransferase TrmO [Dethiosulfatarculus sandiegensis]|uniref:TsaA-like domain-containing protein n=1 Tax=Dethiosulfatarculus sandiegensis TaxID=1429043 RepID=A0A0D2G835_9BACT|nr:tRNA (N6-threonylcarbamoyladenosine(37)-N6)-methyltransferase TrmO [Dethiosulfatarculus sandiegensis]KIX11107.1 hypothetical protein X474_25675 [Dethiosulfatarculus sandiegensis]